MSRPQEKSLMKARGADFEPVLEQVKGNTWCIVLGYARIPVYKLDEHKIIMIDSGLPQSWEQLLGLLEKEKLKLNHKL